MRLCDELAELSRYGELAVCGVFADLVWPPHEGLALIERDPAFTITTTTRLVAFARIGREIRFYAGARDRADEHELGTLADVAAASRFAARYLVGESLRSIDVPRLARSA
jgi:hypothetical protein